MAEQPRFMNERSGCLVAWLVVLLLALGAGSMLYFYIGAVMRGQGDADAGRHAILLSVAFSVGAAGAASLLVKRRFGFYLLVISFFAAGVLQFLVSYNLGIAVAGLLNLALIWWLVRPVWRKLE